MRCLLVSLGLVATVVNVGCSSSTVSSAADAALTTDAGPASDAVTTPINFPPTACPLEARWGFSFRMTGSGPLSRGPGRPSGTYRETLDLYVPQGRVAGAPVIVAFATSWPHEALTLVEGRFDDDLGVTGLDWTATYGGRLGFRGGMAAPSGSLFLRLSGYLSVGTDVRDDVEADVELCPSGEVPFATLRATRAVSPRGVVELVPSTPIAGDLAAVRLRANGMEIPADVSLTAGVLRVAARTWLPPGTPVTIDPRGLADVTSHAFGFQGSIYSLFTTAVVTDREFDTEPPVGAIASDHGFVHMEGSLRTTDRATPYRLLVALGTFPGASRLRAATTLAHGCEETTSAWLVAADGSHVAMPWEPGSSSSTPNARTLRGSLTGTGPWWLLVESDVAPPRPGWRPSPPCTFSLDRVTAE